MRSRRWPNNQSYWGITYHVIQNTATKKCLMVNGGLMYQQDCNPGRPEHLSFEIVEKNPSWTKAQ
jgi:hypothetical protein